MFALAAILAFFVRTRPVLGPVVRAEMMDWAQRHSASLEVGDVRPRGLTEVRLVDVALSVEHRGHRIDLELAAVDIAPSLADVVTGRPAIGAVRLVDGDVSVGIAEGSSGTSLDGSSDDSSSTESSPEATGPTVAGVAARPTASPFAEEISVELRDVNLQLESVSGYDAAPVATERAELVVRDPAGTPELRALEGFGRLSDGVRYSVSSQHAASGPRHPQGELAVELSAERPMSLNAMTRGQFSGDVQFRGATLYPTGSRIRVCLRDLTARRGAHRLETAEACFRRGEDRIRGELDEVHWRRGGEELPIRFVDIEGSVAPTTGAVTLSATATGPDTGRASVDATWHPSEKVAEIRLESGGFRPGPVWPLLGVGSCLSGGILDGHLEARVDPVADLVELSADLGVREAAVEHRLLGEGPFEIDASRIHIDALGDLALEKVSLVDTRVALGDLRPVSLTGSIVEAGDDWVFEVGASADGLSAPAVRDALPESLALPARGAEMRGQFDASLYASAHTAYPESLRLEVDIDGDVRVLEESRSVDVPSLAAEGPPGPESVRPPVGDTPLTKWIAIDTIPGELPGVLLAAEDTRFYGHRGFDWRGIRNAMVHNLEVGRLDRGGSTISQQVAKNLYFSHRRTVSRKVRELWATWRLESELSKRRILELYINLAEWGPGSRGLREAARAYFGVPPEELTIQKMTVLSALLPNPSRFGSLVQAGFLPSSRVEKIEHILNNLEFLGMIDAGAYERMYRRAKEGRIGGLTATICRDDEHAPASAPDCPEPSES